jgi:hypothetical protein
MMSYFKFLNANKFNKLKTNFKLNMRYLNKISKAALKSFIDIPGPKVYPIVGSLFQTTNFGNKNNF